MIAIISIICHLSTGLLPEPREIEIYIYIYIYMDIYKLHENRVFVFITAISLLVKDLKPCSSTSFLMKKLYILSTISLSFVSYL